MSAVAVLAQQYLQSSRVDVGLITGSGLFRTTWDQLDMTAGNGPCLEIHGPDGLDLDVSQSKKPDIGRGGLVRHCTLKITFLEGECADESITLNYNVRYRTPDPEDMVITLETRKRPGHLWLANGDGQLSTSVEVSGSNTLYLVPLIPGQFNVNDYPTQQRSWWGLLVT